MAERRISTINGQRREIYNGLVAVGSIVRREDGWRAIAAAGLDLGSFRTEAEARTALLHHRLRTAEGPVVG